MTNIYTVYTTINSSAEASTIAKNAVAGKLAACANIFSGVESVYQWNNTVETASELVVLFKVTPTNLTPFIQWLTHAHPYDTPAIITYDADATPAYFNYMQSCTT